MFQSYLKIALRNLRKHTAYTLINVIGLAIGMTCCILILRYIQDELSYDRYHEAADQIYRLRVERFASGGEEEFAAAASAPMGPALINDYPQVVTGTRFARRTYLVRQDDRRFYEERFFWADSTVFDVFSFELLRGEAATALQAPYTVVLTASMAEKYFGSADPLGQVVRVEDWDLTVTGVVADVPPQSHFTFDFLGSFTTLEAMNERPSSQWGWWGLSYYTYVLLDEQASVAALGENIRELPSRYIPDQERNSGYRQFLYLQPLTDIHLYSRYDDELEPNSSIAYVYIFSAVALFLLLIACINFMNLATARSTQRAKEVGMRKMVGARKKQLVAQFLGESVLIALMALGVALILIQVLLPLFNDLAAKSMQLNYLSSAGLVAGLVVFAIGVGVLAGLYPAFILSGFRPMDVFQGSIRSGRHGVLLRKGLVVFQFAISVVLIAGSLIVYQQLVYMQTQNLGFEKEQILVLNVRNNQDVLASYEAFKGQLATVPAVHSTAFSSSVPGRANASASVISRNQGMTEDGLTMPILSVDYDFVETYGLRMIAGEDFSREMASDSTARFLINESALKALGETDAAAFLGTDLTRQFSDTRAVTGVVQDFHYQSLQHAIQPLVLLVQPDWYRYISVKISGEAVPATIAALEAQWSGFSPGRPMEYFFLDDDYDRQYRAEVRVGTLLGLFTLLAIFVACLGLFGLASFITEQRRKEIGVRKVLGASVGSIVVLLSKDFTRLVLVAAVLAVPVAYFLMAYWLQDFPYRIEIGPEAFLLAGLLGLVTAWLTVGYQSVRAALTNPVDTLRYE